MKATAPWCQRSTPNAIPLKTSQKLAGVAPSASQHKPAGGVPCKTTHRGEAAVPPKREPKAACVVPSKGVLEKGIADDQQQKKARKWPEKLHSVGFRRL